MDMSNQWLWADGGESACAPGSTMPALWGALGAGSDGLSLTVRRSKDGRLVCLAADTIGVDDGRLKPVE